MKTILAELHDVITSLETKGFEKEATELNGVFKKIAQAPPKKDERSWLEKIRDNFNVKEDYYGPDYSPHPVLKGHFERIQKMKLKLKNGLSEDVTFGPLIGDIIMRIYDGARVAKGLKKNQNGIVYNEAYAQNALRAFNNADSAATDIISNDNKMYMAAKNTRDNGEMHTQAQPGRLSEDARYILDKLGN
jgi:hypothetical protein